MTDKEKKASRAQRDKIAKMTPKQKAAEQKKKADEAKKAKARAKKAADAKKRAISNMRVSWNDIAWMLINSQEFLYRH